MVISSIHTDIFGRSHKKCLEIKGELGNINQTFIKTVTIYQSEGKKLETFENFEKDFNSCYLEELKHFIASFKKNEKSNIPLEEGIHTMKLILAAEKSQNSNREEVI